MNYLIWPISLFIAEYFSIKFPIYYGHRIQIYIYIIGILVALTQLKGEIPKNIFKKKVIMFIGILLIMQLISMIFSYYRIDIIQYNKSPLKTFIAFCSFIFAILIHYFVVRLNINEVRDVKKFLRGGWIALIISLIVCYVQLFYLFSPAVFEPFVKFFGSTLEARWGGQQLETSFYKLGSYVQTTLRINGLTEEASNLATQLFVIFVPFILASIKNKFNVFYKNSNKIYPLYMVLVMILILLLMAKTTSGFLFCGIVVVLIMKDISKIQRIVVVSCAILIGILIYNFNFRSEYLTDSINNFLLNKQGNSVSNRSGSMIALVKVSIKNFIIGIGWEYHTYFIFENLPEWARHNTEYYSFVQKKEYPIMSVMLGWTVEYGALIVGVVIAYVIKTQKKFRQLSNKTLELKLEESKFIKVLCDSSYYYLIFTLISSVFLYVWYASIYLIIYFFFISTIYVVKKNLSINASDRFEGLYEKN
ncbi:hypothetical protein [Priestia megaterium]|uniref:hypothetical protein n=1 Tax=Priestia megaterium TaxID=1404 RepID=UPI002E216AA9|nr:hypothetical protein [Priestia megaterium]